MGEQEEVKDLTITAIGQYKSFNIKNNKSVDLSFKFSYDERINMVQAISFIGQNVTILAKKGAEKPVKLGMFNFHELKIDRDGEATIKFNSDVDYVFTENVNAIVGKDELLKIRMQANIIMEETPDDN
jgi:glutathione peroxidase-family protein